MGHGGTILIPRSPHGEVLSFFFHWLLHGLLDPRTFGRTPWLGDQSNAKPLPKHRTIQHRNTQTHIHAPSRIRTCDLNVQALVDSEVLSYICEITYVAFLVRLTSCYEALLHSVLQNALTCERTVTAADRTQLRRANKTNKSLKSDFKKLALRRLVYC
jgi:hypothetical protein